MPFLEVCTILQFLVAVAHNLRIRPGSDLSQIYQYPTRSIYNCSGIRGVQPVEAGKHSNNLPGRVEQLLCFPRANDRFDDFIIFHYQPPEN